MKDIATDSALSPDERVLVVAGQSATSQEGQAGVVVAFDTVDASVLWVHVHRGERGEEWSTDALSMAPDGERVFVVVNPSAYTAQQGHVKSLDLQAGDLEWSLALGPGARGDALTTSPEGHALYVAGGIESGTPKNPASDAFIAAVDPKGGNKLWEQIWSGGEGTDDRLGEVAADENRVYAVGTGGLDLQEGEMDYLVLSYDHEGGDPWTYRPPAGDMVMAFATDLVLGEDNVYATGARSTSDDPGASLTVYTVSLGKLDGAPAWEKEWTRQRDRGHQIAIDPDERTLFVAGTTEDFWVTLAMDADTGDVLWDTQYQAGKNQNPSEIVVDAKRSRVYVAGGAYHEAPLRYAFARGVDAVTLAYDTRTGDRAWMRSYDGPGHNFDAHVGIHLVGDADRLLAPGHGWGDTSADALVQGLTTDHPLTYEPRESRHNDVHLVSYLLGDDAARPGQDPLLDGPLAT